MRGSIARDGFPGDMANWICSAFKSTEAQDHSSIYLGFKRIEETVTVDHAYFLDLIHPGNAAIIFNVDMGPIDRPIARVGHYTCAWTEDVAKDEAAQGYYHYDSLRGVEYSTRCQRIKCQFDWQERVKNCHRVLYIFNLPLAPSQRDAAINGAVFNLTARFNGILKNALLLGDINSNIFAYLPSLPS